MDKEESFRNSSCEERIKMAERELSAFIRAVTELFGPEQARLSTKDWLVELDRMDRPHPSAGRDWRAVTVAASVRLARRGIPAPDRTLAASSDTKAPPILSSNCVAAAVLV